MECVCFTLIVDDIVLPHGETVMEVLGGGGPQTLFGYQLVTNQSAVVGLSAGVGPDLPRRCKDWLESLGVDTSGLVSYQRPTPRAWQVFEEWGRRTQIWRNRDDPCEEVYDMLRPKYDALPLHFQQSRNYHLGIHPLYPPVRLMKQLREAARAHRGVLSIEPYTAAEELAKPDQVSLVLSHCDIFSPNTTEAESMVGPGTPEELAHRLLALSPPGGADLVVVRCGPEGVLVARRAPREQAQELNSGLHAAQGSVPEAAALQEDVGVAEAYRVPAVKDTDVVDVTGCGNAFCGGFLAALYRGTGGMASNHGVGAGAQVNVESSSCMGQSPAWVRTGDLQLAGAWGCVAASFMAEEKGVPLTHVADLQMRAKARLEALLPQVRPVRLLPSVQKDDACRIVAAARLGKAFSHSSRSTKPQIRSVKINPFLGIRPLSSTGRF